MDDLIEYYFEDDGMIPNNPDLPLLIWPSALSARDYTAEACRNLLESHQWGGSWVNGIYSYHHYHSTAHEVLAVIEGDAEVKYGGRKGETVHMSTGDVVYIPAGVGHCCLSSTSGFRVVGAYPDGQGWDLCTGKADERPDVLANIKDVALPQCDAVTGERQPLLGSWH